MKKSTAANIAQQARRTVAARKRASKLRAIAHEHDWESLPPLPDVPPQRRCKVCGAIQTHGPHGWL